MENSVENLNNLFTPVIEKAKVMSKYLSERLIDHALDFQYGHHIKINGNFISEMYPIPTFRCELQMMKAEICFDVYTNKEYIGYIKLYPNKDEILSLDLNIFKKYKHLIYGYFYDSEVFNAKTTTETKSKIKSSQETKFVIYADFKSLKQIFNIVEKLTDAPPKFRSNYKFKCDCGHQITITSYNGRCPICKKESGFRKNVEAVCPVCESKCLVDECGNGECKNCGWYLSSLDKQQEYLQYPNLISLNKAKKLYSEGKPFEPDFEEFIVDLLFYSEMQFCYKGQYYGLNLTHDNDIEMWKFRSKKIQTFHTVEEFKNNAKVKGKLLKDIWNKTTDRNWL